MPIFAIPNGNGVVAQMVEQWTENPCVGSSILPDTTPSAADEYSSAAFPFLYISIWFLPRRGSGLASTGPYTII